MTAPALRLRATMPEDLLFLRRVHASTRAEEFAAANWPPAELAAFLDHQFELQHAAYRSTYPEADFSIILADDEPAGRLYVCRESARLLLIDIALLPACRGRGFGTRLLRDLQDEAMLTRRSILAQVEIRNPARRLYERLGFFVTGENGPHLRIEWRPPRADLIAASGNGSLSPP